MSSRKTSEPFANRKSALQFVNLENLTTLIVTWNVNAKLEEPEEFAKILRDQTSFLEENTRVELIVIGLQEIMELNATNVIGRSMTVSSSEGQKWLEIVDESLKILCKGENQVRLFYISHWVSRY